MFLISLWITFLLDTAQLRLRGRGFNRLDRQFYGVYPLLVTSQREYVDLGDR